MEDSEVVAKGPCECGGWKSKVLYSDGHSFCFRCSTNFPAEGGPVTSKTPKTKPQKDYAETKAKLDELLEGSVVRALPNWGITQATARYADYRTKVVGEGKGYHIAPYRDKQGRVVFAKVRVVTADDDKADFFAVGDQSLVTLQGIEHLGRGGKMVVVAEGEKDRLTGLQLWNCKFPVVSLPFGAESSEQAFAGALEELSRFEQVVLALDMDGPGREGAVALARMLPPGKAFIAEFPEKDLTDVVQKHGADVAKRCIHNATPYQPDGVLDADEVDGSLDEAPAWGYSLPDPELYEWTYGWLPGQVWVGGGGTSVGKSEWSGRFVAHHIKPVEDGGNGQRAAVFNWESSADNTLRIILAQLGHHNYAKPDPIDGSPNPYYTPEQFAETRAYRREKCGKLFINDHKGSINWDSVKERIRYLRYAYGVTLFMLDPVAALVAQETDKNAALDRVFAEAKALAEELGVTIFFWSHLTRPSEGPNHEEGGRVHTHQFRGSNSISMWADVVIGIERNQQAEDLTERCTATCRTLKVRKAGENTGRTFNRVYNVLSGELEAPVLKYKEATKAQDEGDDQEFPPD